ncbi:MAG: hypothetical protein RL357_781 [Pseudomonadota bacterium]
MTGNGVWHGCLRAPRLLSHESEHIRGHGAPAWMGLAFGNNGCDRVDYALGKARHGLGFAFA